MTCAAGQSASALSCWCCSVALVAFAATAVITARPGDPMLWPPRPGARTIEIAVVSNGYHAGVALPRAALAEFASGRGYPALIAVTQRFAAYEWIEFGWGDREFYRSVPDRRRPVARACAARAVLAGQCVRAACRRPRRRAGAGFPVGRPCARAALDDAASTSCWPQLDATFVPPRAGVLADLGPGLYGPSLFYPANGSSASSGSAITGSTELLGAAGLPTTPVLATMPAGLMLDLRWRAGLRPVSRTQGAT